MARHDSDPSTTFTLQVVSLAAANTEYSVEVVRATRKISIQAREMVDIRFSMTSEGVTGNLYQTVRAGTEKYIDDIYLEENTILYFATSESSAPTIEVESWKGS